MDHSMAPPRSVIFDLGDVLFTWSASTSSTIPGSQLRGILSTPIWHSYERGEITRDVCYELSGQQFSLPASEIAKAFAQARQSLQADSSCVAFIRELKRHSTMQVYAMSNIGKEDFEELALKMDWSLFDRVFTSAAAGMRKPEVGFYRFVLDQIGLAGSQTIFIDDKEENIRAAQTLGIRGHTFGKTTIHVLREMFETPVNRGWRYLFNNAKQYNSVTSNGVVFADNFANLLIVDALQDQSLVDLAWGSRKTWNFFASETVLVPGGSFPDDLDTTSLALQVLRPLSDEIISSTLNTMAEYANKDGTFQIYYDRARARTDPVVSANILACFYSHNRGQELEGTLQLVRSMLLDRSYMQGTRYYPSPDCCLGFLGRLLRCSGDPHLHRTLGPLLRSRACERLGLGGSALDLAMRILTCAQVGVTCRADRCALLGMQCEDGSWEPGWMYQYGSTGIKIGNRGVTTAMAIAALSSSE